nr:MAG TPA: hypothetical protein [Caudoviricetes sp.]
MSYMYNPIAVCNPPFNGKAKISGQTQKAYNDGSLLPVAAAGGLTLGEPQPYPQEIGKYLHEGAFATFYYRLLTNRTTFNFGIVTGYKGEHFSVWNGYREWRTLTRIEHINLSGVEAVPRKGSLPLRIAPYRSLKMLLKVLPEGAAVLNGKVRLHFDNGEQVDILIRGLRLILLNVVPNWKERYKERFSYRTDTITSYSLKEQRRSLLSQPRREYAFNTLITEHNLQQVRNALFGWQNSAFVVPLWYQRGSLKEEVQPQARTLKVDTRGYDFVRGATITLWNDYINNEVGEIESINGDEITLTAAISRYFPPNTAVYPSVAAHLDSTLKVTAHTDTVATLPISVTAAAGSLKLKMPELPPTVEFDGMEVLEQRPNWNNRVTEDLAAKDGKVDYRYGVQEWIPREVPSLTKREFTFLIKDYAELTWWKGFIHRKRGSAVSFLVPSWTNDAAVIGNYRSGSDEITLRDDNITTILSQYQKDRAYLRFRLTDGTVHYTCIKTAELDGSVAKCKLKTPITRDIQEDEFVQVSFMTRMRFASDELELTYHSDDKAEFQVTLQQIRE